MNQIEFHQSNDTISAIGRYYLTERKIMLYYFEYPIKTTNTLAPKFIASLKKHEAKFIELDDGKTYAAFDSRTKLTLWYIDFVLCHELAHHYILTLNKYRKKKIDTKTDEKRTDRLAGKIFLEFCKEISKD